MEGETYLGDGLYASFDGYSIVLRTPRADGDHWIGLEPSVLVALETFIKAVRKERDEEIAATTQDKT